MVAGTRSNLLKGSILAIIAVSSLADRQAGVRPPLLTRVFFAPSELTFA